MKYCNQVVTGKANKILLNTQENGDSLCHKKDSPLQPGDKASVIHGLVCNNTSKYFPLIYCVTQNKLHFRFVHEDDINI